jgi:hypothetical protein
VPKADTKHNGGNNFLAFFDGTHGSANDPTSKIGNGHGTDSVKPLWELHPVFKLTID